MKEILGMVLVLFGVTILIFFGMDTITTLMDGTENTINAISVLNQY